MRTLPFQSLGLLLAIVWAMPANADNGVIPFTDDFTLDFDLGGTCLNEVVRMEFNIAGFEQFVEQPSGGGHFLSNGYVTITATGLSTGYVWLGKGPWPGVGNQFKAGEWNDIQNLTFAPVGDGPRWQIHTRWHYTFDANGQLQNNVLIESLSCLGM